MRLLRMGAVARMEAEVRAAGGIRTVVDTPAVAGHTAPDFTEWARMVGEDAPGAVGRTEAAARA